jgi:hypothetical protein
VAASRALLKQLSVEGAPGCFGNIENVPCLISFMLWPEYRSSILEGVVASIGGISASLSERCIGAVVCFLCQPSYMSSHAIADDDVSGVRPPRRHLLVPAATNVHHVLMATHVWSTLNG